MENSTATETQNQHVINYADAAVYIKEARDRMDERLRKLRGEKADAPAYTADKSRGGYDA